MSISDSTFNNSPVVNHLRGDFLFEDNKIHKVEANKQKQNVSSNDKPKTLMGKILSGINNNKILCAVIAAIIVYFIKIELDKKYSVQTQSTIKRVDTTPKHK